MKPAPLLNSGLDSAPEGLERDPRWKLVQRIVADPGFARSPRLCQFLLFAAQETLQGRSAALNEQRIGEAVFGRPVGYDPREDNIVRSHASRLRARLDAWFLEEGAREELVVEIPRGTYVPVFTRAEPRAYQPSKIGVIAIGEEEPAASPASSPEAGEEPAFPTPPPKRSNLWLWMSIAALVLVAVTVAVTTAVVRSQDRLAAKPRRTPSHLLWSQMFRNDLDTLIVPADSNLVIAQGMLGHPVTLADYAAGSYRTAKDCSRPCDYGLLYDIENLRYTSIADLEFAVALARLPEALPGRTHIRYARDLQMEDFKDSNLIIAGSMEANPWLEIVERQMNFILRDGSFGGVLRVDNRKPQGKEKSEYPYDEHDPQQRGLATIAFLKNQSGQGNILLVQGFTLAGTQAAAEYVTSGAEFDTLFHPFVQSKGRLPHFEILLETMDVNGMASHPVVLALHTYP